MSNAGSSRASSIHSFKIFEDRDMVSCNLVTWQRLQTLARAIRSTEETIEKKKEQLEPEGELGGTLEAYEMASSIHNLRVLNEKRSNRVDQLKRMCAKKRIAIAHLEEEEKKKDDALRLLQRRNVGMSAKYLDFQKFAADQRKYLNVYTQLVRLRRKQLIRDLRNVFDIKLGVDRVPSPAKPDCPCSSLDSIHGVHLPSIVALAGHADVQLSTSLGLLSHLLEMISRIIDYPLRYPLQPAASTSHIRVPKEEKTLALFGTRWRADRDRLAQAVTFLSRNIAQLWCDSGFSSDSSPAFERPLQAIAEWMDTVLKDSVSGLSSSRPWNSLSSPSCLMEREEESTDDRESVNIIRNGSETENGVDLRGSKVNHAEMGEWSVIERGIGIRRSIVDCDDLDTSAMSCLQRDAGEVIKNGLVLH